MPAYKAYPTEKTTPSRKARKGERSKTYAYNRTLRSKLRREKRVAREEAQEAAEQAALEAQEALEQTVEE